MSLDFYLKDSTAKYETEPLYQANITHNLSKMADKARIYDALWQSDKIGVKYAKDIIEILERGLIDLRTNPKYFKRYNSSNGWGKYEQLVFFVTECLDACKKYPEAEIEIDK
jgi:hypothetical protein